ncbi:MAG: hypothetical protein WCD53_26825 [Microcoleus sp.]
MNPRAAADWSARLVTVSVVKTLPIDLSEVAYIAIDPPSPPGGSETGFLHKISVERQRLSKKPGLFCLGKGRSLFLAYSKRAIALLISKSDRCL